MKPEPEDDTRDRPADRGGGLSRRTLLKGAGAAALATYGLAGCGGDQAGQRISEDIDASAFPPVTPKAPPSVCNIVRFFDAREARDVEAATARLIPGSPEDPGAKEACVTTYIDSKLAEFASFAEPTYFEPPFAEESKTHRGEQAGARETIYVKSNQLARYGFQSSMTPQEAYRAGLSALRDLCRSRHRAEFHQLGERDQDRILAEMEDGGAKSFFEDPAADDFFELLLDDTIEGMFADPVYGGNRDLVGWKLVGYPGAQRFYTERELRHGTDRPVQGIAQMPSTSPGHPQEHAILPVSGSERG